MATLAFPARSMTSNNNTTGGRDCSLPPAARPPETWPPVNSGKPPASRRRRLGALMWQERLSEFVTLFLVVNPVGVLPVFIATAGGLEPAMQRRIALRAVLVAFAVLAFFVVAGEFSADPDGHLHPRLSDFGRHRAVPGRARHGAGTRRGAGGRRRRRADGARRLSDRDSEDRRPRCDAGSRLAGRR